MKKWVFVAASALVLGFSTGVHAIPIDNGGGLIYDTAPNITWYDHTYHAPLFVDAFWDQANGPAAGLDGGGETGWVNTDQVPTLLPEIYWSGKEYAPDQDLPWHFDFGAGDRGHGPKNYGGYFYFYDEWEMHHGLFGAPVPIPGTVLLLASGVAGLAAVRRRFWN